VAVLKANVAGNSASLEVEDTGYPSPGQSHSFFVETVPIVAENEMSQKIRPHPSLGIFVFRAQAVAQPIEVARLQMCDHLLFRHAERAIISKARCDGNGRSRLRGFLVHETGIRLDRTAATIAARCGRGATLRDLCIISST